MGKLAREGQNRSGAAFTRQDTTCIKAVAVLMMLYHHLTYEGRQPVGFPGWTAWVPGFVEKGFLGMFCSFGKLCVPIFYFVGGYGLYCLWRSGKFSLKERIISLYKTYWKIFLVFVPIAFLFFSRTGDDINQLCTRYVITSKKNFLGALLGNFFGYSSSFNSEWWFLICYIMALPMGVCFCEVTKKTPGGGMYRYSYRSMPGYILPRYAEASCCRTGLFRDRVKCFL